MAKTPATLETIAPLLEVSSGELHSMLINENKIIKADPIESVRYQFVQQESNRFIQFALDNIRDIAEDEKYFQVLKRIIHRNETRHFYFYANELEAIRRILDFIDDTEGTILDLSDLSLHSLPSHLRWATRAKILNISKNKLKVIQPVASMTWLESLIADDNKIGDISYLAANRTLKILSLNRNGVKRLYEVFKQLPSLQEVRLIGNRITNEEVKPILECLNLQRIQLEDNGLSAPLPILSDIDKLRVYYQVTSAVTSFELSKQQSAQKANGAGTAQSNATTTNKANDVKSVSEDDPENVVSYAIRQINLKGNPEKSLLDIEKLSSIFYNLICNSDNTGEHFFGLFGRWGRGKTYFWKHIQKNDLDRKKYIPVEFHAWKYQDTPGIWAYLYKTLNDAYLTDKPNKYKFLQWFNRIGKLFVLNRERGKLSAIVVIGLLLGIAGAAVGWLLSYWVNNAKELQAALPISIPVGLVTMGAYVAKAVRADVQKVVSSVTTNVNVNSQLGFQHEIQQELKHLLKAWFPNKNKKLKSIVDETGQVVSVEENNRRVFLFIDDIDRCSEDKIIQIVDYIRVLLHDQEIQDRITVLAAIDERILLHAIQDKYKAFVESKDNRATYKELCREYMDKLFLAGLKLGPLTESEMKQMVDGFTSRDTAPVVEAAIGDSIQAGKTVTHISDTMANKVIFAFAGLSDKQNGKPETNQIPSTAHKEYPYERWELESIKAMLTRYTESTPRSIRVYMYRYLLGKQLVEKVLTEGRVSYAQWYTSTKAKRYFAFKLLHYSFKSDVDTLMADYKNYIADYDENRTIPDTFYDLSINLNQELGSIMYQVLTMIVAY